VVRHYKVVGVARVARVAQAPTRPPEAMGVRVVRGTSMARPMAAAEAVLVQRHRELAEVAVVVRARSALVGLVEALRGLPIRVAAQAARTRPESARLVVRAS